MAPAPQLLQQAIPRRREPVSRVAFYSHDTYGLGHLRRCLGLASALVGSDPNVEVLLVTGSPRAYFFETPARIQVERIPAVTKDADGAYITRDSDTPLDDTVRARKRMIRRAVLDFAPDLFVVDHAPSGLRGELLPLLGDLRHRTSTRLALGLRDILDEPERVIADWRQNGTYRLLEELYHDVWVYGAREVFALERLYEFSAALNRKVEYLGYLGRERELDASRNSSMSQGFPDPTRPHLLCLVGGGGDGFPLASAFVEMLHAAGERFNGTLVTGPFLSQSKRRSLGGLASELSNLQVLRFTTQVDRLIAGSDAVITMGGYNSVMEALSLGRPTLIVPRTFPRREQALRAHAFERLGLVRALDPDALCPTALLQEAIALIERPPTLAPQDVGVRWDGAEQFVRVVRQQLAPLSSHERSGRDAHEPLRSA
ncbi:MAG: glycosyltransferase family protein [Planctomycetota bacterium]